MFVFLSILGFFWGAVLGSFANAIIYRIPNKLSFVRTPEGAPVRSICPHCKHVLSVFDLFPIISWLFLFGRCRYCNVPIGTSYVVVELFTAFMGAGIAVLFGFDALGIYLFCVLPFFMSFIVIFLRHRKVYMLKFLSLIMVGISIVAFFVSTFYSLAI
ncbi:MAG: prepilin peptidase [Alphaproteobacteria bacterium]|nr:prepilin peptidase [Alphaproteobacteria bacterium]